MSNHDQAEESSFKAPITPDEDNQILSIQATILEMIVFQCDAQKTMEKLCTMTESLLDNSVASIMLKDNTTGLLNVISAPSLSKAGIDALTGLMPEAGGGSCVNAVFTNEPHYVTNTFEDERWCNVRQLAHNFNICSCWSMPIRNQNAEAIASFALTSFEHRSPTLFHKKLLDTAAYVASILFKSQELSDENQIDKSNVESLVNERTKELQTALSEMQDHLVYSEKMVLLGQLVAGVAHEISTPIGVSITSVTHLSNQMIKLRKSISGKGKAQITRSKLEEELTKAEKTSDMIFYNLDRAASHIRSFREVAVDQSSEKQRTFMLYEYLQEVVDSLHAEYRRYSLEIHIDGNKGLELDSYPGAYSQIVSNLIINSLKHGLNYEKLHNIWMNFCRDGDQLTLTYQDDGVGVSQEELDHLFEPFYTTKRSEGCSGLGLHIIYSLVTKKLKGTIEASHIEDDGLRFTMKFPINL